MTARNTSDGLQRLGDFEIVHEVGRGGMGVVYEARQISLKRRVALKVISGGLGLTPKAVQRFRREAEAAAKLHHTNIVPVYTIGEENGAHFYAMELIDGPSLDQVIKQMRQEPASAAKTPTASDDGDQLLPDLAQTGAYVAGSSASGSAAELSSSSLSSSSGYFDTVARMIAEVADALEYAHQAGVIHRDMKPSNLLLSRAGRLSVNDFGLARMLEQPGMTMTGEFVGTPAYMSPEQITAGRTLLDHRTDIYSLGATLYELLTLRPPFTGERRDQVLTQIMHKEPTAPRKVNKKVPVDLETICQKAMEKDPDRRYQTAAAMAEDLRRYVNRFTISARRAGAVTKLFKFVRRNKVGVAAALVIVFLGSAMAVGAWKYREDQNRLATELQRTERERWMREEAMPNIRRLVDEKNYAAAFDLAEKAEQAIPDDPSLARLRPEFTSTWSVSTDPPGADVYAKPYMQPDAAWKRLGRSPLDHLRLPKGFFRWRVIETGYVPVEGFRDPVQGQIEFKLDTEASLPPGMVRVSGNAFRIGHYAMKDGDAVDLEDFFIDRNEVTNRQFKEFVDQGGYQERKFWKEPFLEGRNEGVYWIKPLSWEDAMKRFHDQADRPGPSTWLSGSFPAGEDDYPVRGISWHEAAAYAEFAGKSLPTVLHWIRASGALHKEAITSLSNFEHDGPARVGTFQGLGPFGTYDMAGNAKEWCSNKGNNDNRYILGGSWNEPTYMFAAADTAPALDRSPANGFRCVRYLSGKNVPPAVLADLPVGERDYRKETPVSDEEFRVCKSLYAYDKTPLNDESKPSGESDDSIHETITFDAAYGENERVIVHLYLPRNAKPPFQTVIFYPGSDHFDNHLPFPAKNPPKDVGFLVRSGRAVCWPVYKGSHERSFQRTPGLIARRDWSIQIYKDLGRSVDYLENRPDIDREKLAYLGSSFGAWAGQLNLAVDDRFKVGVWLLGGLSRRMLPPEIDGINFVSRVHVPVLMINGGIKNGRDDPSFPLETSVKPLYEKLGTPNQDKALILHGTGAHELDWERAQKETLEWLDKYLGKVH